MVFCGSNRQAVVSILRICLSTAGVETPIKLPIFRRESPEAYSSLASFHVMGASPFGVERVYLQAQFLH